MKTPPRNNPDVEEKPQALSPRSPLAWEESEEYQRVQARTIVVLFVVIVTGSVAHSLYTRDWIRLSWWGKLVGGIVAGVLVWSASIWILTRLLQVGMSWFWRLQSKGKA